MSQQGSRGEGNRGQPQLRERILSWGGREGMKGGNESQQEENGRMKDSIPVRMMENTLL